MDKNTITGFVLITIVVVAFSWFSRPSEAELRQRQEQDSIAAVMREQAEKDIEERLAAATPETPAPADSASIFFARREGQEQEIVLENNVVKVVLSTLGGTVESVELKGYDSRYGGNVTLLTRKDAQMSFALEGKQENIITSDYYFRPEAQTDSSVTMMLDQPGKYIAIAYTLHADTYMMNIHITTGGLSGFFSPSTKTMTVNWIDRIVQQEKGYDFENRFSSLTYKKTDKGTKHLKETSNDEKQLDMPLDWIAFKNQFFSAVLIAPDNFTDAHLTSIQETEKKSGFLKTYEAEAKTAFDPSGSQPTRLQMYLGPNDFHKLKAHNKLTMTDKHLELEELVDLGWPLFRWINRWFIIYLFDWLTAFGLPMGIVLALLTIIVKTLVYPTTKKSFMSSAKMRVLKPQIDALNKKYPKQEDAMKKQQEMMQIYSQYGVSPMGGCLPMLIQTPIWIALFNFVPNAIELRGQSFLWANDLSAYDDVIRWGKDLWLIGDHLSLFCILFSATNLVNTWISMRQQQNQLTGDQAQQMKMMQYMMYFMPLMFFFVFNNYSSGLCYYYFLSGLLNIIMMWYLRKTTDDRKLLAKLEAYREQHKNDPKKTSGMAARLEALQKQAQMMEEQRRKQK
ncbi:MAG: membrane protein insertase YidC [Bacteroidaceae bacterium]|nr:membrane protein insertase YidC [Bacteroidaceae bacterium]